MQVQSLGWEDPPEQEMATHSSILAWKIPWVGGGWWAAVHEITVRHNRVQHSTAATVCAIPDFSTFHLYLLATYILEIMGKL